MITEAQICNQDFAYEKNTRERETKRCILSKILTFVSSRVIYCLEISQIDR